MVFLRRKTCGSETFSRLDVLKQNPRQLWNFIPSKVTKQPQEDIHASFTLDQDLLSHELAHCYAHRNVQCDGLCCDRHDTEPKERTVTAKVRGGDCGWHVDKGKIF